MAARQLARRPKGAKTSRRKKPSNVRYLIEERWLRNRRIRIEREERRKKENAAKKMRVPRGSARARRRAGLGYRYQNAA